MKHREHDISPGKNTMLDRQIVEKTNSLLEDYRTTTLAGIVESWDTMSCEQCSMSTLNSFFCGMHILVRMADTASATLPIFAEVLFTRGFVIKSES